MTFAQLENPPFQSLIITIPTWGSLVTIEVTERVGLVYRFLAFGDLQFLKVSDYYVEMTEIYVDALLFTSIHIEMSGAATVLPLWRRLSGESRRLARPCRTSATHLAFNE